MMLHTHDNVENDVHVEAIVTSDNRIEIMNIERVCKRHNIQFWLNNTLKWQLRDSFRLSDEPKHCQVWKLNTTSGKS
jgi:hypothetical protein